jgi:error-prone DNA polymerase
MNHPDLPAYAELHCLSNFSFGLGASLPEELVARAHALGYSALALTDECSVAGLVRAHTEAKKLGLKLLPGSVFSVQRSVGDSFELIALPRNLNGWGNLCEFITAARRAASKGEYRVTLQESDFTLLHDCELLLLPQRRLYCEDDVSSLCALLTQLAAQFGSSLWLALELLNGIDDALWLQTLTHASVASGVPLVATGGVLMHVRSRKPLHDVLTATRQHLPLSQCGQVVQRNAEAHLRQRVRLGQIYPRALLENTLEVAARCAFNLDEIRYQYPMETVDYGQTPTQTLARLTWEGAGTRYPHGIPANVQQQVEHELALIAELKYEMYFLTVHDIVRFARSRRILCQGRGSAANSAVCYCLGITEVDPSRMNVLFERFISRERDEPPDIDVDFEHQRREEVIQYIYAKYGRERAALTAVVVSYRPRSALRDVGRALEIDAALIAALSREHPGMYSREVLAERLQSALEQLAAQDSEAHHSVRPEPVEGVEAQGERFKHSSQRLALWLDLSRQLMGFPRHLGQHVGGFVLTQGKLTRLVPVENAAMIGDPGAWGEGPRAQHGDRPAQGDHSTDATDSQESTKALPVLRSIIQWDKDDLDAMGLLKVDVLALGMLSAIRRCLDLMSARRGHAFEMQDIPAEDSDTYDMICQADTVGVFQIESRAQMSMLPRLKPRCFYDLVVEVAIVRPGPIQGGMVHPYLKARAHPDAVVYPSPSLKEALKRTLGVPIFQEQVMQIAMLAAGFSAGEADSLRRSMAAWKRKGGVHKFYDRMVSGMTERGYTLEFSQSIFKQIEGFGEYGFPESHAASFALLVYVSCWLKRHEPACFLTALLNSQPLGFYSPSQLVQDAKRHGVEVRAVDVMCSEWDCTLKELGSDSNYSDDNDISKQLESDPNYLVRLGLRLISGLSAAAAQRIVAARHEQPFTSTEDLALRAALDQGELKALAAADALAALSGHRRQQVWDASALKVAPPLLKSVPVEEDFLELPAAPEGEEIVFDYASTGLTLRRHPLCLLRETLAKKRLLTAQALRDLPSGALVRACGIVTVRQQPQTAHGVTFVTLEDETGTINVIVWKALRERQRSELLHAKLLAVYGVWQRDVDSGGQVCHLIAKRLVDLTPLLGRLATESRDFH